jgi:hypothetical protein
MIPQNKIMTGRNHHGTERFVIPECRTQIWLLQPGIVHINRSGPDLNFISRDSKHPFDKGLGAITGVPEHDNIPPMNLLKPVNKPVYKNPLLVHEPWLHAGALDFHRLDHKDYDKYRDREGKEDIAEPGFQLKRQ